MLRHSFVAHKDCVDCDLAYAALSKGSQVDWPTIRSRQILIEINPEEMRNVRYNLPQSQISDLNPHYTKRLFLQCAHTVLGFISMQPYVRPKEPFFQPRGTYDCEIISTKCASFTKIMYVRSLPNHCLCDSDTPPPLAIVTPPRVSGTRERWEAERGAWSFFVCVGSFSLLLNRLNQYWNTSLYIYDISHWCRDQSYRKVVLFIVISIQLC